MTAAPDTGSGRPTGSTGIGWVRLGTAAKRPGWIGPGFWTTQLDGLASAGQGGSGGPAYVRGHTGIEASGVIVAIDMRDETTCLGIPVDRDCSTTVFTVGLNLPFEDLGLQLLTRR